MRKIASLLTVLMLFCALAFAQTRTVSGTVRDAQGNPIPFATVTEAGTKNAVRADENGRYSIRVAENARLTITATGYTSSTIGSAEGSAITLGRSSTNENLQEVVVTALGIRKKAEEIGYATARVTPEQITAGRNFNLAQALSGKVSGLTISNTSASVNANPRIVLRGLRSLTGNNEALIVLDGVPVPSNTINYINPNDVERVDVMKGGQAATLFGSDGVNGAIIITTKRGSQKPEITVGHSSNVEKVAYMPRTQHNFGSGSAYGSNREENFHSAENQQYGPAYDGVLRALGRTLPDGSFQLLPYQDIPDAREKLWDNGYTAQTDFSYRAGDANSSFFASYQNVNSNGIVFGDKFSRNSFRLNAGKTYGKVNLGFDATYTWDKADRTSNDFYFYALNTASWIPIDTYKDWRNNKFADPSGYFNDYYNNPWWRKDNERSDVRNNYFNSNIKLTFKPIQALDITGRIGIANTQTNFHNTANSYTYTAFSRTNAFVNNFNNNYDRVLTGLGRFIARTPIAGGISDGWSTGNRLNADLFGVFRKEFGDISLNATVGSTAQVRTSRAINANTNGIGQPNFYNFNNSATGLFGASNSETIQRKIGGYVDATFGFKGFAYLHAAYRRDYTSLFSAPEIGFDKPFFDTYGADVSIILSDAIPSLKSDIVDNLKVRASYNVNGNDNLSPNQLQLLYNNASGFPLNGLLGVSQGGTLVSPTLSPEIVKTAEVGFELGLVKNRFALEGSYYKQKSEKQIIPIDISPAAGFQAYRLNAADLDNWGYELDARARVLQNKDWNVTLTANYGFNKNKVNNLYGATGINSLQYQSDALVSLNAEKGQMFPYLKTTAFERDSIGRIIIDPTDGWPERADDFVGQGTTTPIHVLGTGINVGFKNFTLIANAEYRAGHIVYHDIGTDMTFTGSGAMTTIYNRQQFIWPNSVYRDGSGKLVPNTNIAVDNYKAIYQGFGDQGFSRGFAGTGELYVSSGAFWKLRDLSLTFDVPKSIFGKVGAIRGIALTAWARNLVTILPEDNWYTDPEFSNTGGNAQGINTTGNTPPVRQIGGTIKLTF